MMIFLIFNQLMQHCFFTFPICFKYQVTIEWSTLSSSASSHVVLRGAALMIALNLLLSSSGG